MGKLLVLQFPAVNTATCGHQHSLIYNEFMLGSEDNITLEPGEMLLFESSSVIHGHPFPLVGSSYAMIFIHFEPTGHSLQETFADVLARYRDSVRQGVGGPRHSNDLPPYLARASPEEENWRQQNPLGWQPPYPVLPPEAHAAAKAGEIELLRAQLQQSGDQANTVVHQRDQHGWQVLHQAAAGGHQEVCTASKHDKPHGNGIQGAGTMQSAGTSTGKSFPLNMSVYEQRFEQGLENDDYSEGELEFFMFLANHGVEMFLEDYSSKNSTLRCREFEATETTTFTAHGRDPLEPEDGLAPEPYVIHSLPDLHPLRAVAKMFQDASNGSTVRVFTTNLGDPFALILLCLHAAEKKKEVRLIIPNSIPVQEKLKSLFVEMGDLYHHIFVDLVTTRVASSDSVNKLCGRDTKCFVITDNHFALGDYSMARPGEIEGNDESKLEVFSADDAQKPDLIRLFDSQWQSLGEENDLRNAFPEVRDWVRDHDFDEPIRIGDIEEE